MMAAWAGVLAVGGAAWAIINPNFTPRHLVQQAEVVCAGTVTSAPGSAEWKLAVSDAPKGKPPAQYVLDLSKCNPDQVEEVGKLLAAAGQSPVLLFTGTLNQQKCAYLHVGGQWLALAEGGKDRWNVRGLDAQMTGTYVGGTDMLIRMTGYLLREPEADVPITAGIRWLGHCKVGKVSGEVHGLAAIEIGTPPRKAVFVACGDGDRLFVCICKDDEDTFEDVTPKSGLDTKSRRFAWLDVNRDGLADLVSWDGKTVSVRIAGKDGTFKPPAGEGWNYEPPRGCIAMSPFSRDGSPGVLVGTDEAPLLLSGGADGWKSAELPAGPEAKKPTGPPSAPLAADFDNDGFADVLLPRESGGVLWKGKSGGFQAPAACAVGTGRGVGVAAVGDFDGDGSLDVFLSGRQRNTIWENDGKARFTEVLPQAGSIAYKCPPQASDADAVDVNHDGRTDLCLVYAQSDMLYHFNRGFRSFGEEGEVRLAAQAPEPGQPLVGQKAVAVGDFNGDSALDMVAASPTGEVYCYFNDRIDPPGVVLRLGRGVTGPVTASCWMGDEKRLSCVGTVSVTGHSPGAYVAARMPGRMVIRWRLPGRAEQSRTVTVEAKAVDMVLEPQPATERSR